MKITQHFAPSAPACYGCGVEGPHAQRIAVFDGQVLPPTWEGDWMQAPACPACYDRQQALLHPVTLMIFRHKAFIASDAAVGAGATTKSSPPSH
jgi:hypothetical protein